MQVYVNGMSVACKADSGKSTAATPDVCFTPPITPATPPGAPIPYPNTCTASNIKKGSKKVKVMGKEVSLKDKSHFKKSSGNEAANTPKKGIVTSQKTGKASFCQWSMDVKFEGKNVSRHMDLTLHNTGSLPANTPTWPYLGKMTPAQEKASPCKDEIQNVKDNCKKKKGNSAGRVGCPKVKKRKSDNLNYGNDPCINARRCMLAPYKAPKGKRQMGRCCKGQTPHHIVPKHHFAGMSKYKQKLAPCVCAEGHSWHRSDKSKFPDAVKTHPAMHDIQDAVERLAIEAVEAKIAKGKNPGRTPDQAMNYGEARDGGIAAHQQVFSKPPCSDACLKAQIDAYHNQVGVNDNTMMATTKTGASD